MVFDIHSDAYGPMMNVREDMERTDGHALRAGKEHAADDPIPVRLRVIGEA